MIWWKTFFEWSTRPNEITTYRKYLSENIFSLMELMKLQYHDVIFMPVKKFLDLIKWKNDLEQEKQKLMKEHESKIKSSQRQKRK